MPMVRAMRMLNAIELGTLTSGQLETLLADPSRQLEWTQLCQMRGQMRRMAATGAPLAIIAGSTTATGIMVNERNAMYAICSRQATAEVMAADADFMSAVAASATAMSAVAASATAMSAVIASPTAMSAVIASPTAMSAVAASATAMSAVAAAMSAVAASATAMSAVIASSTAMSAVAASSTAMSAVAASSTAMSAVAASSTAMSAVIASSTAMSAIFANATATTTFKNSTALTAVQVPTMTSNTAPSGVAAASGEYSSEYAAWKAFDGNNTSRWQRNTAAPNWISYQFAASLLLHTVEFINDPSYSLGANAYIVQVSNDGTNWTDVIAGAATNGATLTLTPSVRAVGTHWRLYISTQHSGAGIVINSLNFKGFAV